MAAWRGSQSIRTRRCIRRRGACRRSGRATCRMVSTRRSPSPSLGSHPPRSPTQSVPTEIPPRSFRDQALHSLARIVVPPLITTRSFLSQDDNHGLWTGWRLIASSMRYNITASLAASGGASSLEVAAATVDVSSTLAALHRLNYVTGVPGLPARSLAHPGQPLVPPGRKISHWGWNDSPTLPGWKFIGASLRTGHGRTTRRISAHLGASCQVSHYVSALLLTICVPCKCREYLIR